MRSTFARSQAFAKPKSSNHVATFAIIKELDSLVVFENGFDGEVGPASPGGGRGGPVKHDVGMDGVQGRRGSRRRAHAAVRLLSAGLLLHFSYQHLQSYRHTSLYYLSSVGSNFIPCRSPLRDDVPRETRSPSITKALLFIYKQQSRKKVSLYSSDV